MRSIIFLITAFLSIGLTGCGTALNTLDTPPPTTAKKAEVNAITPAETLPRVQAAYSQFVDVRTPEEYAAGHATRAINIPLDQLSTKFDRLEKNEPVYVICQTGRRSKEASDILIKNGYNWVFNVEGGTAAWQAAGLPMEGAPGAK